MDEAEKSAQKYLTHRGFAAIEYEPDGKVPPDFLVDGRIAVEVRRLNQHDEKADGPQGLEQVAKPLHAAVTKVLAGLGPPSAGVSWFVTYTFRRPLPPWKQLEWLLTIALRRFQDDPTDQQGPIRMARGFHLRFDRASKLHPTFFVLGGSADHDSGGFVVSELARNLEICIDQKSSKIARVRDRYPEWWLVLEDRIAYGALDESDRQELRELVRVANPWSQIILVNPLDPSQGFEL